MSDALEQLIRLHGWALDEKRRKAADLERLADRIRGDIGRLEADLAREREAAAAGPIELQRALPAYAGLVGGRRAKLAASLRGVEGEIERAQADVAATYRELKTYEQALSSRKARQQAAQRRREQAASDELGLTMFRRRR